ncbi:MAG: DUF6516 family protein [Burkholderiaceae bacterium]|nr:DUF6516 family protein [Burkholderiaceae bacterium]
MPPAICVLHDKTIRADGSIVEMVVWLLNAPLEPCSHNYKYRLYYGREGVCRVRYDNELGKGDHRHIGASEAAYAFVNIDTLLGDFERDIDNWS